MSTYNVETWRGNGKRHLLLGYLRKHREALRWLAVAMRPSSRPKVAITPHPAFV